MDDGLLRSAFALQQAGNLAEAARLYDEAVRANPGDFNALCLRGKCDEDHDLGYELMRRFGQIMFERLQATRLQLLDVYGSH